MAVNADHDTASSASDPFSRRPSPALQGQGPGPAPRPTLARTMPAPMGSTIILPPVSADLSSASTAAVSTPAVQASSPAHSNSGGTVNIATSTDSTSLFSPSSNSLSASVLGTPSMSSPPQIASLTSTPAHPPPPSIFFPSTTAGVPFTSTSPAAILPPSPTISSTTIYVVLGIFLFFGIMGALVTSPGLMERARRSINARRQRRQSGSAGRDISEGETAQVTASLV